MEALAALSLACNILQLVGTGIKVTAALKKIRDDHEPNTSLEANAIVLRQLSHEVQQSIKAQNPTGGAPANRALLARAQEVAKLASELEQIAQKFTGGRRNVLRDTIRYMRNKSNIEAKEERLRETQQALQSTILVELRETVNQEWSTISQELPSLRTEVQTMATELHNNNTNASSLTHHIDKALAHALAAMSLGTTEAIRATMEVQNTLDQHNRLLEQSRQTAEGNAATEKLLDSLYFPSMNARRNMSTLEYAEGTFDWVFDRRCRSEGNRPCDEENSCQGCSTEFSQLHLWLLHRDQSLFWISGNAGTGKSTFVHYLIQKVTSMPLPGVNDLCGGQPPLVLSAFIWASGDELQRSIKGLLCTLLHQIFSFQQGLVTNVLWSRKKTPSDWSETGLLEALHTALRPMTQIIYIFVDGLDEISQTHCGNEKLLKLLWSLRQHSNIKLCVASRPEPIFERSLQRYPHLRLQDLTYKDIVHYLKQELEADLCTLPTSERYMDDAESVITYIADHAQGVFLWVQLVTQSLKAGITNTDTWELLWLRIKEVPDGLESLYESMLCRQGEGTKVYRDSAATFFMLLLIGETWDMQSPNAIALYLDRDLRDVMHDFQVGPGSDQFSHYQTASKAVQEQLRAQCAGLVQVPALYDGRVQFIHRTARDFMLDQGRHLWSHVELNWRICIDVKYLLYERHGSRQEKITIQPVELWTKPLEWELHLSRWISHQASGNQKFHDNMLDYFASKMVAESNWHRDYRNPAVVMVYADVNISPARCWVATWLPSEMSKSDFLNNLLLSAAESRCFQSCLWLLAQGANPFWHDTSEARGSNWPTAFVSIAMDGTESFFDGVSPCDLKEPLVVLCRMLQHPALNLDEYIVCLSRIENDEDKEHYDSIFCSPFDRKRRFIYESRRRYMRADARYQHYRLLRIRTGDILRSLIHRSLCDNQQEQLVRHSAVDISEEVEMIQMALRADQSLSFRYYIFGFFTFAHISSCGRRLVEGFQVEEWVEVSQSLQQENENRLGICLNALDHRMLDEEPLPKMDCERAMDWLVECGFPEDKRADT
ncbi:ankyrin repeat domain-containing protein 50 [Microdochium nivale]|nr:ankyrin repeat domain-containing protein 50 [Microdochium nivale]